MDNRNFEKKKLRNFSLNIYVKTKKYVIDGFFYVQFKTFNLAKTKYGSNIESCRHSSYVIYFSSNLFLFGLSNMILQ